MGTGDPHSEDPRSGRPGARNWRREARRIRNPLLRRPTSAERRARGIGFVLLALVALATGLGCLDSYRGGVAVERAEADRRPVKVTVIRQVQSTQTRNIYLSDALLEVTYRIDGVTRTATMSSVFGAAAGTEQDAWADQEGRLVPRPHTHSTTLVQTGLIAIAGVVILVGLTVGGRVALAVWSMRLRAQEWEAEWLAFDTDRRRR